MYNKIDYNKKYNKENYKNAALRIKLKDYEIIDSYCKDMNISKQSFFISAALYVINNDIPISEIKQNDT